MRRLVPEVVQSSNMDCGPAALKCLLEGFGIPVHYGRLREACQTDVDGTSIDTIEEVANQLGLEAEQIVLPADHVLLDEARALPAIAVVVLPNGVTHFVVVWRRLGGFVQLMDPATGRRWTQHARFLSELYIHQMEADAGDWREYACSDSFLLPLRRRIQNLGIKDRGEQLVREATAEQGWKKLATLDAAVRLVDSLAVSGAIGRGGEAERVLSSFLEEPEAIPEQYWSARPAAAAGKVVLRGAVLVRCLGLAPRRAAVPKSPELAAALQQPAIRPGLELLRLLAADGAWKPAVVAGALALASGAVLFEAILLRGLLNAPPGRFGALAAALALSAGLFALEIPLTTALLGMGRRLELRLRRTFLRKIPLLGDRYFQSRLTSDMAERSHSLHLIRRLPDLGGQFLRYLFEIAFTTAGIVWLDPASAWIAIFAAIAAVAVPFIWQPVLMERDLRLRTHSGALSRFYLDAMLGLVAIHTHGAQPAVRREHGTLLAEWKRAGYHLQRTVISLETIQFVLGFALAIWLLAAHLARSGETGGALLLVYWALNLPALGQEVALLARQYPAYRNVTLRLLEPLGALEQRSPSRSVKRSFDSVSAGCSVVFDNVSVTVSGHSVLQEIQLTIDAGSHVAIAGPSGAGKSSLVGLLLGWYRPAAGRVVVDGVELDERSVEGLRPHTAWVDPAVQLWNRPLSENLEYGSAANGAVQAAVDGAGLRSVIDRLPHGLDSALGEGGGLVSGGEGQRVRFGRAWMRSNVRLAILDEPFRGLDAEQRHELLNRAREHWKDATLLHISHDIAETMAFDRVIVLEGGRIVEDGRPGDLAQQESSRFRAMLDAERAVREGLWASSDWRRLKLDEGVLVEP